MKDKMSELYKATQMPVGKITVALKEVRGSEATDGALARRRAT